MFNYRELDSKAAAAAAALQSFAPATHYYRFDGGSAPEVSIGSFTHEISSRFAR